MSRSTKRFLRRIITVLIWVFIARVILSWIPDLRENVVGQLIYKVTDIAVVPIQSIIPPMGGLDLSVLVIVIVLTFVRNRFLR